MPHKTWQDDVDTLDAATIQTFLQDQVTNRFTDVSERDAALPSPAPGMLAYTPQTGVFMRHPTAAIWVPVPGTEVAKLDVTGAQSIPNGTATAVVLQTGTYLPFGQVRGTTDRYTPLWPGRYEVTGHVSYVNGAGSYRYVYLNINTTGITGSHAAMGPTSSFVGSDTSGSVTMNGTTDYVQLMTQHNAGAALSTAFSGAASSTLRVIYLGPAY